MLYNLLSYPYGFGYGLQRPKFFMAEHLATAEGENRAYGPTLLHTMEDDIKNVSDFVVLGTK